MANGNGVHVGPDRRSKKVERDVRGWLAMMCVIGSFALSFMGLTLAVIHNVRLGDGVTPASLAEIPAWTAGIVGTVVGYYFGSRGAAGSEQVVAAQVVAAQVAKEQSVTLEEVHQLTNSARTELVKEIQDLREELTASRQATADARVETAEAGAAATTDDPVPVEVVGQPVSVTHVARSDKRTEDK